MMDLRTNVIQVPVEGGSGHFPSGPLTFLNDWPGLWLRGDTCIGLKVSLMSLRDECAAKGVRFPSELEEVIKCIENGVRVKKSQE